MFTGMIICAVLLKIVFHHLTWLARVLPESCVLIVIGVLSGTFIHYVILDDILHLDDNDQHPFPKFSAELFFHILLPPIILDSALSLYDQAFFDNFISVIIFAVFGTLFNVFTIGFSIFGLSKAGALGTFTANISGIEQEVELAATECLIFSSLISAVDPVAVLAIFEEIHVNIGLYFLVFGESLFNDGVTVVLYNTMIAIVDIPKIGGTEIVLALLSFLFVVFGGSIIGFLCGIFVSYILRFTEHVRVVEPLILFSCAYTAFLGAEVFHWSGIISIIAYGITVKRYGFQSISKKSYTTVKYSIKTLASTSDCIIFLFLGIELIKDYHEFHVGFITATIVLCLVFRFLSTFFFSWLVNLYRKNTLSFKEQFIMAYGGLRGAVGFSLAMVLREGLWYREMFITAALAMVFFTVFLQGGTIKFFVKLLNVELQKTEKPKICTDVQTKLMEDVMDGLECIVGRQKAKGILSECFRGFDKALKSTLINENCQEHLQRKFEKIVLEEHITNLYAPRIIAKQATMIESPTKKTISLAESRKSFKTGLASSKWRSYKSQKQSDPRYVEKEIVNLLQERSKRAMTMESKVLEDVLTPLPIKNRPANLKETSVNRSKSVNWGSIVEKASKNASLIKDTYDLVQSQKRVSLTPLSCPPSISNNNITFSEVSELREEGEGEREPLFSTHKPQALRDMPVRHSDV